MSFDINAVTSGVTGANDTKYPLCPAGEWPARVKEVEGRQVPNGDGGLSTVVDITWVIEDESVKSVMNLQEPTVRQGLFLDLTADDKLDTSEQKNVRLGRLREALGCNDPDVEFSFDQMKGQFASVTVVHNPAKNDPETIYSNITKVAPV